MLNKNSIDPSLQKKIFENESKFKLLFNKGLPSSNHIQNSSPIKNKNNEIILANQNGNNNDITKSAEKRLKYKENKKEKKYYTNIILRPNNNNKFHYSNDINYNINYNNTSKNRNRNKLNIGKEEKISKSFANYNQTFERYEEDIKKLKYKIAKQKILKEKTEPEKFSHKPMISKGSKKYDNNKIKEDFFERQKNFMDKKEQKNEKLKEILIQKEEEELQSNNKNHSKLHKNNFQNCLNNMEKREKERLEKIERMKKEQEEKIENEFDFMPKINENSAKMVEKNKLRKKQPNTFIRLAQQDKILSEKKKILTEMYTPTFQPFCYEPLNLNMSAKNMQKKNFFEENYLEELNKEEELESDDEEEEKEDVEEESEKDGFDYQQDIMKFTDEQVEDVIRGNIFHHKKKIKK